MKTSTTTPVSAILLLFRLLRPSHVKMCTRILCCCGVQWVQHEAARVGSLSSVVLEADWMAGWLAGSGGSARSLISITSHRCRCHCCRRHHCLPLCPSSLLSSCSPSQTQIALCITNSSSVSIGPSSGFPTPLSLFLKLTGPLIAQRRSASDSAGFVMNGILLHIRRK